MSWSATPSSCIDEQAPDSDRTAEGTLMPAACIPLRRYFREAHKRSSAKPYIC